MKSSSRQTLILVHGWASDTAIWSTIGKALSERYRLVEINMPGYADGPDFFPDDLEQLSIWLRDTTPSGAIWLAWSMGALPVIQLAAKSQSHIRGLNLIAPVIRFCNDEDWPHGLSAEAFDEFEKGFDQDRTAQLERFYKMVMFPCKSRSILNGLTTSHAALGVSDKTLHSGLRLLKHADVRDLICDVRVPVTLFHGERDAVVSCNVSRQAEERFHSARLSLFDDAGHAPFLTHPDEFIARFECHGRH
ncbi:MAG: pimeloyl-[acyl-carrier protein] methyl ester esterase [marine bacterium B5-7]|nr:MAG: pimeloyl-[acyl-carrier protein] methyl ester esterase [marine bacterium B5-7]